MNVLPHAIGLSLWTEFGFLGILGKAFGVILAGLTMSAVYVLLDSIDCFCRRRRSTPNSWFFVILPLGFGVVCLLYALIGIGSAAASHDDEVFFLAGRIQTAFFIGLLVLFDAASGACAVHLSFILERRLDREAQNAGQIAPPTTPGSTRR
jgi:hypothetical protein